MRYIIATDYDGTLYQYHKGGISKEVIEAINEFRAKGNLFGVVTGRSFEWAYPVFEREKLFPFDFCLSNSGSCAVDSKGNEIFRDIVDVDEKFAERLITKLLTLCDDECGIEIDRKWNVFSPEYPDGFGEYKPHSLAKTVKSFVSSNVVFTSGEKCSAALPTLEKEFGHLLTFSMNDRNIDISAKGVNKATGIKKYADLMGVCMDNIFTAGDNFNDIPMVRAYHGCAVSNAVDALKAEAEFVCEDIAELIQIILSKENQNGKV